MLPSAFASVKLVLADSIWSSTHAASCDGESDGGDGEHMQIRTEREIESIG